MPVKKKNVKTSSSKVQAQISVNSWFFKPDMAQGVCGWVIRAVLFAAAITGFTIHEVSIAGISLVFGLFLFMPRRYLDRESFVAVLWRFMVLFVVFASMVYVAIKHGFVPWGILLFAILAVISAGGIVAAITCFARKIGVSKIATLLNFPIGISFLEYVGYFLPIKNDSVIAIKYSWYKKLISFFLNTKNGQLLLSFIVLVFVVIAPTLWEVMFILFFGILYFWKQQKWMIQNIKKLTWVSAIMNVIFVTTGFVYYFYYYVPGIDVGM